MGGEDRAVPYNWVDASATTVAGPSRPAPAPATMSQPPILPRTNQLLPLFINIFSAVPAEAPSMNLLLLLPLLIQFSLPCTSTSMDPQEMETLFHVMETMSSDRDWRSSNPDPCSSPWPGIECKPSSSGDSNQQLHVTRLAFGVSPNPTCKPTAIFPAQVFALPRLQSLFFLNCFNVTKTSLSIDANQKAYASLEQLSLKSNPSLVGAIPPEISSLNSLQVLTLSQNHLTGRIPDSISQLASLVHLDLSYNVLTSSIPPQIGQLKKLINLDLSYNSLSGRVPQSIGQMVLLQKLDLSSNDLTGRIPETIGSLTSLEFLALSDNKLNGELPNGMAGLLSLQYLIMDDNPMFISLPAVLGRLDKLQELRLGNSGYSGEIPESFARLTNLTSLSLERNRLSGEIPADFSDLGRIYHLNLSWNLLSGVVPFGSGFIRRLGRNLDLSGNPGLCLNASNRGIESVDVGAELCQDAGRPTEAASMEEGLASSSGGKQLWLLLRFHCYQLILGWLSVWCSGAKI
ncbi:receptor like protein 29-like isoform X2 [Zingiber officinale]|uniref:receptor like protein 29-like isoform X2 n=1 Tax=Zingiber officinale TaxID=94328 RepID=UPI001C4C6955|nr:receptor like protein 29-like isoform X2 [Zingiber officinale]